MIKPKLNAEGQNKHSTILPGEYYRINGKYIKWNRPEVLAIDTDIYIDVPEEQYIPSLGDAYYYYDFEELGISRGRWTNSCKDVENLNTKNCFYSREDITMEKIISIWEKLNPAGKAGSATKAPGKGEYYYYFDFGSCSANYVINNNDYVDKYRIETDNYAKSSIEFTNKKLKGILVKMALQLS